MKVRVKALLNLGYAQRGDEFELEMDDALEMSEGGLVRLVDVAPEPPAPEPAVDEEPEHGLQEMRQWSTAGVDGDADPAGGPEL